MFCEDLLAEVALHPALLGDQRADLARFFFGQILDLGGFRHARVRQDRLGTRPADAVDVGKPDPDLLVGGQIDPGDSCHLRT